MKPAAAAAPAAASTSRSRGAGPAHADIGAHGVVEQQRVLADIGDGVAQAGQGDVADIGAVDP